ncbi:MAG: MaoC/PaaZ C-terminal domain-containing protein [Thermoleophilia bacterium]
MSAAGHDERLEPGRTFTFRRTFTDGDVALFCGVTGDFNPYHLDDAFSAGGRFGRRIVPGLLTGSMLTHIGGLLGVLASRMTFDYERPVYVGDTVECVLTIDAVDERGRAEASATFTNADGDVVLRATVSGRPTHVRLAR